MTIEIFDRIFSHLRLRELGLKPSPLPHDASPTELDVEDSFVDVEDDYEFRKTPKPHPDTLPE